MYLRAMRQQPGEPKNDPLVDWTFDVREISAGVYQGDGWDSAGRSVSRQGTDPDEVLAACQSAATHVAEQHPTK